jgi:hypothetical protein
VSALVAYAIIRCRDIKRRVFSLAASIILILFLFALFFSTSITIYPSPYRYQQSPQNTHSEITGMTNFFKYRNISVPFNGISLYVWRLDDLLLTPEQRDIQKIPDYENIIHPPWHFGYDHYSSIASSYGTETDLILDKHDQSIYTDYFPDMAKFRYYPREFNRVKNDPGTNHVYSNGEFDLLVIRGERQGAVA